VCVSVSSPSRWPASFQQPQLPFFLPGCIFPPPPRFPHLTRRQIHLEQLLPTSNVSWGMSPIASGVYMNQVPGVVIVRNRLRSNFLVQRALDPVFQIHFSFWVKIPLRFDRLFRSSDRACSSPPLPPSKSMLTGNNTHPQSRLHLKLPLLKSAFLLSFFILSC